MNPTPQHNEKPHTHTAEIAGEIVPFHIDDFEAVVGPLAKRHGGIPRVKQIASPEPSLQNRAAAQAVSPVPAAPSAGDGSEISQSGRARAEADAALARDNGFAVAEPLFAVGTTVNALGVENATRSQLEHQHKPGAVDVCNTLARRVRDEQRRDSAPVRLSALRMTSKGTLVHEPSNERWALSHRAFATLFGRFPCASGIAYLNDCPPDLRARNFNNWAQIVAEREAIQAAHDRHAKACEVVLRTRNHASGERIAFAAVSQGYTPFDADVIGAALAQAFPSDAKGVLDYDGERVRVEGLWHSDVPATDYVAGEIFKAGVIVRSNDTGGGSIRIQSVIWRNLCRNLIILDKAIGVDVRIRHSGDVRQLARKFRNAFSEALTSINAFRVAWSSAKVEAGRELVQSVQGTTRDDLAGLPVEAVLPGIFNGILDRELVPVRGRKQDAVPKLLEMHRQDEAAEAYGVSRASIVNAFTRYAHQVETDPFHADEIRAGAGSLLSGSRGRKPAPLPYLAVVP